MGEGYSSWRKPSLGGEKWQRSHSSRRRGWPAIWQLVLPSPGAIGLRLTPFFGL